jgi:DNA-binding transcriptional LysR family regulator
VNVRTVNLRDIDLNLLVVFQQLFLERRVSAVAESLGLTQPAVSNALSRLRRMTGDDLFLRTGRGMTPTPYAVQLAEPIAEALAKIRDTLDRKLEFDPASSSRKFTIAMTDIGEIHFLPRLMSRLAALAPGITVSTVRNSGAMLSAEMEAGGVDLAIGLLPQLKAGYFQRRLFRQRYVCMFRSGHALDRKAMSIEDFEGAQHIAVIAGGTGHAIVDETIARRGIRRNIVLTVPHFVALGHILASTDMIATVPERYAGESIGPFGLRYLPHPVPLPEFGVNLFWHARFNREPGSQWLRRVVMELFSEQQARR